MGIVPSKLDKQSKILDKVFTTYYRKYPKSRFVELDKEQEYSNNLQSILGGNREVKTGYGYIDLLTNDLLIEVKKYSTHGNKSALGQALVYSHWYPQHIPAIAIIGKPRDAILDSVCMEYGILYLIYYNNIWQVAL